LERQEKNEKQSGFTLIELAIVLVIIGLLLGGVLKGQELINSAKVKNMATDFKNVQVYIYGYQDRFKALPADDAGASAHVNGTKATSGTQGDGVIEGAWNVEDPTKESALFWQYVRLANLASGPTKTDDANYYPKNADGGRFGAQSSSGFTDVTGMSGSYVACSAGILGKYAKQLDVNLDDGVGNTGSVRIVKGSTGTSTAGEAAPTDVDSYTVCMAF